MPFQKGNKLSKGRPKGSGGGLKDYDRQKFAAMSDKEKDAFLATISAELRYRMAEGNPANETDLTTKGDKINFVPTATEKEVIEQSLNE